jgi:hypothetical protein
MAGKPARPGAPAEPAEEPVPPRAFDTARLLKEEKASRPEEVVRVILDLYLAGDVRPAARAKLVDFLSEGEPAGPVLDRRVREAVQAILTMPEYQLA